MYGSLYGGFGFMPASFSEQLFDLLYGDQEMSENPAGLQNSARDKSTNRGLADANHQRRLGRLNRELIWS